MKLLTAFLALVLLTIGCSGNWQKGFRSSGESRQKRAETIDNELVVSGSLAVIEEFLSSKGVQAQIAPVAPTAQNLYHVRLEGKVDLDSLIADLEGKVDFVEPNYRVRAESMVDKYS